MALQDIDEFTNDDGVTVKVNGEDYTEGEVASGQTVTPGHVCVRDADGKIQHAGADATDVAGWAPENLDPDDPAEGTQKGLREDYEAGDRIQLYRNHGDKFMGVIGGGGTVTNDTALKSGGGGTLDPVVADDDPDVQIARYIGEDDLDASGGDVQGLVRWER